jgi:hypothetical protein
MARKKFYLIVDTETTMANTVADFGAVICDKNGDIAAQCGVLVNGVFGVESLFYNQDADDIWSKASIERRMGNYTKMLDNGQRMLASTQAINRWLDKAKHKYNPELTAYNLAFDADKCQKTGIDLTMFSERFCLWHAAAGNICQSKAYMQFALENHLFNARTKHGNMSISTTAESVTGFLTGELTDEPHTSIEDVIGYEMPTLVHIVKKRDWRKKIMPYSWNKFQVKDYYNAR